MNSLLARKIEEGDFIITAEYLAGTNIDSDPVNKSQFSGVLAVNVADNRYSKLLLVTATG